MIKNCKETECACHTCVNMCRRKPCWGTPSEIKKIIDAGLGNRLMLDWWAAACFGDDSIENCDFLIIAPAVKGYEKEYAPDDGLGECTFLSNEGKCELHALGLKPIEGRLANHDPKSVAHLNCYEIHKEVAKTWDTDEGRDICDIFWEL